jgi:glucose-6-phosphate dehydrogenase assembly protein OpcA
MPTIYKVLGQTGPSGSFGNGSQTLTATTNTNLYTVPASTSAVVSTITVCNRATSARSFRIAVRPSGAAIATQHYLAYDVSIAANDSISLTLGITIATTDIVTVYASTTDLTFTAFGSEIS